MPPKQVNPVKPTEYYNNWPAAEQACPDGWHLPTDDEWKQLEMYVGMSQSEAGNIGWRGTSYKGYKLKAISGWYNDGNGTDEYGFFALPGGIHYYNSGSSGLGNYGSWWSASGTDYPYASWQRDLHEYSLDVRGLP